MPKVSSTIVRFIKEKGCNTAFGVPGKPIVPLILAMEDEEVEFVLARHECGAGYMAIGYALENQSLGVAMGTSGPGGTNLITAAAQAQAFHAPVLFITGHPPIVQSGKALGQDSSMFGTDLVALFKPVTKFSAKVESKEQLQQYLRHAEEQALTGSKGPVHLSIPLDILVSDIEENNVTAIPAVQDEMVSGNIRRAIHALSEAERPLMVVGKGVHISKSYKEMKAVAERWNIPVVTTPGGKGAIVTDHPLSLGSIGLGGTEAAAAYVSEQRCDLLLVVGSKLSDMSTVGLTPEGLPDKVIQFDWHADFAGKSIPSETILIQGDAKTNLEQLLLGAEETLVEETIDLSRYKEKNVIPEVSETSARLSAARTMHILRNLLDEKTIVFGDDGSHTFYAIKHFPIVEPGTFFFDDVFGAMGHAIGLSIGAKLAKPNHPIACFTGDGCLFMHGTEISTAVDQRASVLFIVFNNGMLDMVDKGMKHNLGRAVGTRYKTEVNAAQFAESLGAAGYRCTTEEEIRSAVREGLKQDGPAVIEMMVHKEEVPPTLGRG